MDDTLEVVSKILEEAKPKRILEIGAAVGYSAICFSKTPLSFKALLALSTSSQKPGVEISNSKSCSFDSKRETSKRVLKFP